MNRLEETTSEESQANRLLEAALRRAAPHAGSPEPPSLLSTRSSLPKYHLHGLATTQTETQTEGQCSTEDSHKENVSAPGLNFRSAPLSPGRSGSSPYIVEKELEETDSIYGHGSNEITYRSPKRSTPKSSQEPPYSGPSKHPSMKGHPFVSPDYDAAPHPRGTGHAPKLKSSRYPHRTQRQRSMSPISEDSFVDPLPYHAQAKLYMENTKNFQIPLSQVGRSQEFGNDVEYDSDPNTPPSTTTMFATRASLRERIVESPASRLRPRDPGQAFVSYTHSSQSDSSQGIDSQSQPFLPSQLADVGPQGQGQTIETGSGYETQSSDALFDVDCRSTTDDVADAATQLAHFDQSSQPLPSPPRSPNSGRDNVAPLGPEATQPSEFAPSAYQPQVLVTYSVNEPPSMRLEATQEATQPSKSPESHGANGLVTPLMEEPQAEKSHDSRPTSSYPPGLNPSQFDASPAIGSALLTSTSDKATAGTSSKPKSLLSMVNPNKAWRLQGHIPVARAQSPLSLETQDEGEVVHTGYTYEATQLSSAAMATDGDSSPLTQPNSPSPVLFRSNRTRSVRTYPDNTDMDVVPDSEATQGDVDHLDRPSTPASKEAHVPVLTAKRPGETVNTTMEDNMEVEKRDATAEEEEEDEVPLATTVNQKQGLNSKDHERTPASVSRKDSATRMPPPTTNTRSITRPKPNSRPLGDSRMAQPQKPGGSWETGVVPSSNPRQDAPPTPAMTPAKDSGGSARPKPHTRTVSHSATPATRKSSRTASLSDSDDEIAVSGDALPILDNVDQDTEPADDDYMDVDRQEVASIKNRKRKRAASASTTKSASKTAVKASKNSMITPSTRSTKRLKSSSVARSDISPPTRVLALWKGDGHYYPGTVYSLAKPPNTGYMIRYDDETEDPVEISKLRLLQLKKGDHVLLIEADEKAEIVDVSRCASEGTVTVEIHDGAKFVLCEAELRDIRIAGRTVANEWKDRILEAENVVPEVRPKKLKPSPTPSKMSLASVGSSKTARKILARTGLIVTLSPGNDNWEKDKDRLMSAIKYNGGSVIEDWGHLFNFEGKLTNSGKRWVIEKDEVVLLRKDLDRVFLISDDASAKPKFLIALALGVPCVSIDWLHQSIRDQDKKDWVPFLLPAGYSGLLEARVSQMIDWDWGNADEHLKDIMNNTVPSKIFAGKTILCLSSDYVPQAKNSKKKSIDAEKALEASRMVPRIILCMGASRVEAVGDAKHASRQLKSFDYVIVKDESDVQRVASEEVNCVHLGWVKDCLVAGRLLQQ